VRSKMRLKAYLHRFVKHLKLKDSGIPGGRLKRILVDVVLKSLLDVVITIITRPLDGMMKSYTWRRKGLNKERKVILRRMENSHFLYSHLLEQAINLSFLLSDNDYPYYGIYQNIKKIVQDMEKVDEIELGNPDLKKHIEPANEIEKGKMTIQELVEEL